jgi:hypothetical protein
MRSPIKIRFGMRTRIRDSILIECVAAAPIARFEVRSRRFARFTRSWRASEVSDARIREEEKGLFRLGRVGCADQLRSRVGVAFAEPGATANAYACHVPC